MNDTESRLLSYCESTREELRAAYDNQHNGEEDGGVYDYLSDALDVEYKLNSSLDLMGVCVYVTVGGPCVWIDTDSRTVEGRWGADSVSIYLDYDICAEIDSYYEEYLDCFLRK